MTPSEECIDRFIKSCFKNLAELEQIVWDSEELTFRFIDGDDLVRQEFNSYTVTSVVMNFLEKLLTDVKFPFKSWHRE
jgi:hypothetical protein